MASTAELHDKDRFFISDRSLSLVSAGSFSDAKGFVSGSEGSCEKAKGPCSNAKGKKDGAQQELSLEPVNKGYMLAILMLLLTVSLIAAAGYWALQQKELLPVKRIQVSSELKRVGQGELQNIIAPLTEKGLLGIDVAQIRADLEKIQWVDTADVRIVWPDGLRIQIKEQAPIARWGDAALLNDRGEVFTPKLEKNEFENLAQLNGPNGQQHVVIDQYMLFREVLKGRGIQIASITLDGRRSWSITTDQGVKIRFGKGEIQEKMSRFLKGYDKQLAGQFGQIAYVDLRYTNGFAIKMKQQAQPGNESVKRIYSNG